MFLLFTQGLCFTTTFLILLSVFTVNGDIVTVTTPSDCRWLQVEYQPEGGEDGDKQEERGKVKVPAMGNMVSNFFVLTLIVNMLFFIKMNYLCLIFFSQLLCEVKQRAIEELNLQEQPQGKLFGVKQLFLKIMVHSSDQHKLCFLSWWTPRMINCLYSC